jgi:predicted ATPase
MLKSVRLVNFFSFGDCTIELEPDLNVLVGINGSGKSNFLRAFQLLKAGLDGRLSEQIAQWGGIDAIWFKGKSELQTRRITTLYFTVGSSDIMGEWGDNYRENIIYRFSVINLGGNFLGTEEEVVRMDGKIYLKSHNGKAFLSNEAAMREEVKSIYQLGDGKELTLQKAADRELFGGIPSLYHELQSLDIYRLFNTTEDAPMRTTVRATGVDKLLPNGDNMFQVLNTTGLKSTAAYDAIEAGLHDVNENFQRFRMNVYGQGSVEFYLQEKGLETPIHAAQVSDGTLSYLCLLVALYQPGRGKLVIFDEPERNLHPDMLLELGKQLERASEQCQILLTTHAPGLLNQFPLRAVRVFEKNENNQTQVRQFTEDDFAGWYEAFAPGQMWRDGALGGNRY